MIAFGLSVEAERQKETVCFTRIVRPCSVLLMHFLADYTALADLLSGC